MSDIPVVIMCGGQGTRMGNTLTKKELVDIGGRPLLWHVMRIFSAYGHHRFILALGHQADQVRRYFLEYEAMSQDVTLQLAAKEHGRPPLTLHGHLEHEPWQVTLVDTGLETGRAARLVRIADYLQATDADGRFFVAYGEAVANIDLAALLAYHLQHGRLATVTGIQRHSQYGLMAADADGRVTDFQEKPLLPHWVNGGFMLFETAVLDHIRHHYHDALSETDILPQLVAQNQLQLYHHDGYWQSMKTLQDYITLKEAWQKNQPWRVW